jgi:hypothetical protein
MTHDPKRLLDDPSLAAVLREDLDSARTTSSQSYDAEAGLERLRAAIAVGTITTAGGAATGAAVAKSGALGSAKVFIAMGVGVVLAAGGVAWRIAAPENAGVGSASSMSGSHSESESEPVSEPAPEPEPEPVSASELAPALGSEPTTAGATRVTPTPPRATRRARLVAETAPAEITAAEAAPTPVDPDAALRAETAHLLSLRRTAEHDPPAALAMAEQGSRDFRDGMFAEEREAIAIFALFELGRDADARRRAARFLEAHPRGPFSARVRQMARDDR